VLAARLSGSPVKGDRVISFNSVSTGSFANVENGMTLLVGTSPGGFDVGRIRVRSATSNSLTVSENSNISWVAGQYLTVIKYWEVWPVYPRIIPDPSNQENVIFYKDYDIPYTNQNSILGTFVCSGPHRAKYIDNGVARISYSSSGTFNPVLGTSLGHFWEFEGGSPSVFAGPEPGNVDYTVPGHYVTKHTVTGSNGCSDVSYRYVSVYPRPSVNNPTTIQDFTMESADGSRDGGGYTAKITIHQSLTNKIIPGTVVVIFAENLYGGTPRSLGGNSVGNEDIFFVGYVLDGTVSYNYEDSDVEFSVGSITELMKIAEGFSISVEDSRSPDTWYRLLDLDCRRAMYHYLRWHSTVLSLADFQFIGTDYPLQFFDATRESLYDAVNNFLVSTLVGELTADRQGKLWAEVSALAKPSQIGTSTITITKNDWVDDPNITENVNEPSSYVERGGIAYSGSTGTFAALMACAPGAAPGFRGKADRRQGLALGGQPQLNQLVGDLFANKNSRFPNIDMKMAGSYLNIDIAPQQRVDMFIRPDDTVRNVFITGSYIPQSVSWSYDGEDLFLQSNIGFREIVSGASGDSIIIPETPPNGGFSTPPVHIPVLSPLAFPMLQSPTLSYLVLQPITTSQQTESGGSFVPMKFVTVQASGSFTLATGTSGAPFVTGSVVNSVTPGIYLINFFGLVTFATNPTSGAGINIIYTDGIGGAANHVIYDYPSRQDFVDPKVMGFNMSCVAINGITNMTVLMTSSAATYIMNSNSYLIITRLGIT